MAWHTGYMPVERKDSEEDGTSTTLLSIRREPKGLYFGIFPFIFHLFVFAIYATVFYVFFGGFVTDGDCVGHLSLWSPALSSVVHEVEMFKGGITQGSIYRGTPSPEIDQAWKRISTDPPGIRIFPDELQRLNKSADERDYHLLAPELGGGYTATIEVFHLLHCLNSLRKATFKDHYPEEFLAKDPDKIRIHLDHCVDILRLSLMCSSDVTPVLFYDVDWRGLPIPDFATQHKCRNFDQVLKWSYENDRAFSWDHIGLSDH